jgi:ABC-type spermidine/putrescine transport system permease subunit I
MRRIHRCISRPISAEGFTIAFAGAWIFLVGAPLLGLFLYSILRVDGFTLKPELSDSAVRELIHSGRGEVILRTLRIAVITTLLEFLIAFPFAFWLAKRLRSIPVKVTILTLSLVPFFLSSAARAIVWRPVLSTSGLLNSLLTGFGVTDQPVDWLLFSEFSVQLGLIAPFFPTMLFPLFLTISMIDDEYFSASADLGAGPWQTLWMVTLPIATPGIIAGVVFTMVPMLGELVVPQLLGGGKVNLLGASVEGALQALNYGVAAAMCSFVLLILVTFLLILIRLTTPAGLAGAIGVLRR